MVSLQLLLVLAVLQIPLVALGSAWFARRVRAGDYVRPEGPSAHAGKAGTPTMAGSVLLLGVLLGATAAWLCGVPMGCRAAFVLTAVVGGGALGLVDDLLSQRRRSSQGITARAMLIAQGALALGLYGLALLCPSIAFRVPFSATVLPVADMPTWAGAMLVLVAFPGTVNAVNVTDGLDGLATGAMVVGLAVLAIVVRASPELLGLALLGLGACVGFLWVNAYPARAFLGNVGSMGLGGLLFGLAYAGGAVFLLPLIGGLFVLELGSVIMQVISYKATGTRLLRMSPLHHHLEADTPPWPHLLRGTSWHEATVVVRMWIVAFVCGLLALLSLLPGGL